MFKYNHDKLLEHKKLGGTHHSWVCPYKEGYNENEWVVKYIHAKNQTEMNDILQNIFLTTSSGFSGLVPIKGYDVQATERGDYNIYCKQPRMMASLKNVINREYSADNLIGSTEKLVLLLHSLVSTLDDMAQQRTFHRNLKPTNILVDKTGHPLLSDLRMLQSSTSNKDDLDTESENLIYIAPEVLSGSWAASEDNDIHKSDVWSLGMIMAQLCLLVKLTPIPTDVPLQETQEALETNIEAIKNRYGANLSRVLTDMLNIDPVNRKTFGEIRSLLEQTFLYIKKKEGNKKNMNYWDSQESRSSHADSYYEDPYSDPFLKTRDTSMFRQRQNFSRRKDYEDPEAMEGYDLLPKLNESDFINKLKWFVSSVSSKICKEAKEFKEGKGGQMYEKARELKGSICSRIYRKYQHFKDIGRFQLYDKICNGVNFVKAHKYPFLGVMMTILFIIVVILGLWSHGISQRQKYDKAMKGINIKFDEDLWINTEQYGLIVADLKEKYNFVQSHYDDYYGRWIESRHVLATTGYNENVWVDFLSAVGKALESRNVVNLLTHLKMKSLRYLPLTNYKLTRIAEELARFKALNKVEFTQISGDTLTAEHLTNFTNSVATGLPKLQSFSIGLARGFTGSVMNSVTAQIFTDFKYLKELTLEFEELPIYDYDMTTLASVINQNGKSLTSLTIKVSSCNNITPEGFKDFNSDFFHGLSKLDYLSLDFSKTRITNDAIFALSEDISHQCKYLKSLLIYVPESPGITSSALRYLALHLNSTRIKGLEHFSFTTGGRMHLDYHADHEIRSALNYVPNVSFN